MDFKVIITQAALDDLEEIVEYISRGDPQAATRVARDLVKRAELLARMPLRGKIIRARKGVRWVVRSPLTSLSI